MPQAKTKRSVLPFSRFLLSNSRRTSCLVGPRAVLRPLDARPGRDGQVVDPRVEGVRHGPRAGPRASRRAGGLDARPDEVGEGEQQPGVRTRRQPARPHARRRLRLVHESQQLAQLAERVVLRREDRRRLRPREAVLHPGPVQLEQVAVLAAAEAALRLVQAVVLGAVHHAQHRRPRRVGVLAGEAPAVDPPRGAGRVRAQEKLVAPPPVPVRAPHDPGAAHVALPHPEEKRPDRRGEAVSVLGGHGGGGPPVGEGHPRARRRRRPRRTAGRQQARRRAASSSRAAPGAPGDDGHLVHGRLPYASRHRSGRRALPFRVPLPPHGAGQSLELPPKPLEPRVVLGVGERGPRVLVERGRRVPPHHLQERGVVVADDARGEPVPAVGAAARSPRGSRTRAASPGSPRRRGAPTPRRACLPGRRPPSR